MRARGRGRANRAILRPRRLAAAGLVLALGTAAPAAAHPYLVQTAPRPGAVAPAAPRSVTLSFSEAVVPSGSSIHVAGPGARPVRLGRRELRGKRTLTAALHGRLPPAVYDVRWVALGNDGHTVSGSFRFGIPTAAGGPPPGADRLGAPGAPGGQTASGDTPLLVAVRWLGLAAAGVLLAGAILRRRLPEVPDGAWRLLSRAALALATATAYCTAAAAALVDGRVSFRVLTDDTTGVLAIVRLALVLALGAAALVAARRRATRTEDALLGGAGAAGLVTYALSGHVESSGAAAPAVAAQVAHVLAAGIWMGGLIALATGAPRGVRAPRVFAPLGAACVGVLAATGLLAALREVNAWYFLRWSDYGRVVIAKAVLLLALAPLAVAALLRVRRGAAAGRVLRAEAVGALALVLLASVLTGLAPGRGQPLPAQRGNLLAGAAFATVATDRVLLPLTLAPAQPGANVIAATPAGPAGRGPARASSVAVTLSCSCDAPPVVAPLRRGPAGTWSARVSLPRRGTWLASASVDGRRAIAPAALGVGDAPTRGSSHREALMTADLTGPDATRCRAAAEGALLAVGRLNAHGGVAGGHKLSVRVVSDGGDPTVAERLVRRARAGGAVALLGPCGGGAAGAVRAAAGLPTLVADPAVPAVGGRRVWRTAGDPRAEGVAVGRYVIDRVLRTRSPTAPAARRVAVLVAAPAGVAGPDTRERLAGLQAVLRPAGVALVGIPDRKLSDPRALRRAMALKRDAAVFVDGDPGRIAAGLRAAASGTALARVVTAPVIAASPLFDERFQRAAGNLGLTGAIASPAEVLPDSADGRRYSAEVQSLYGPDRPSVAGLRGYVAGLALDYALRDGDAAADVAARLRRPKPFTDALVAPWRAGAPAAGGPLFVFYAPRFLPATLVPIRLGGEQHSGTFFEGGKWQRLTDRPYGALP